MRGYGSLGATCLGNGIDSDFISHGRVEYGGSQARRLAVVEDQQHHFSVNVVVEASCSQASRSPHDSSTSNVEDHLVIMVHGMKGRYVLYIHVHLTELNFYSFNSKRKAPRSHVDCCVSLQYTTSSSFFRSSILMADEIIVNAVAEASCSQASRSPHDSSTSNVEDHLVIMVHGMKGSEKEWMYVSEQLAKAFPEKVFIHRSKVNERKQTYDGVDVMGE
ncbi:hypothetical protein TSUD_250630 [Trifolium subterraneum]|nr:hypothetical protein TSUD_250630 [Trifolium subterraneum]